MNQLALIAASSDLPTLITSDGDKASIRFLEFFAANIRNPHACWTYGRAVAEFLAWCDDNGVPSIAAVVPGATENLIRPGANA
jgi:hypothetical protein